MRKLGEWLRKLIMSLFKKKDSAPWPSPDPTPNPPDLGVYIDSDELEAIVRKALGSRLTNTSKVLPADTIYYCPSKAYVEKLLASDDLNKKRWTEEIFDCDDFAYVLKAYFSLDAYDNKGHRRAAHALSIIWGRLPGPHAINGFVDDKKIFWFIEPQTDAIFRPGADQKQVWLMVF